jgi:ribosomal protein S12 methylthiotransferase
MPLQHASNSVLARMRRQITVAETTKLIEEGRKIVPGLAFRTTFLVGFPGETEEEFEEMVDFVREMRFERLGVFQYSHEENTRAFDLEDDISPELKEDRAARLMEVQQSISWEKNQAKIGQTMKVLFDRVEGEFFVGRTEFDSPEVDNEVLVSTKGNFARIGDFANVLIKDATDFDLFGDIVVD